MISDKSFFLIQGLLILAFIAVILLFVKSDYAGGIFTLRREAIEAVRTSDIEDMQGQRVGIIYDSTGGVIAELKNERNIRYLTSEEIPQNVKDAFISVEDKPVNLDIFARGLCLPSDIKMTEEEQDFVIAQIKKLFE